VLEDSLNPLLCRNPHRVNPGITASVGQGGAHPRAIDQRDD
jgi:hypothetical protein